MDHPPLSVNHPSTDDDFCAHNSTQSRKSTKVRYVAGKSLAEIAENPRIGWLRHIMDNSNVRLYALAKSSLNIQSGDIVLDVGFGGGKSLQMLLEATGRLGKVLGVDPTKECIDEVQDTYSVEIQEGRMSLHLGFVDKLPYKDESVDHVMTINCVYFWRNLNSGFQEIRRILRTNGKLAVGVKTSVIEGFYGQESMRNPIMPCEISAKMREHGFGDIKTYDAPEPKGRGTFYCVTGSKL